MISSTAENVCGASCQGCFIVWGAYIQHNRQTDDGHSGLGKALQAMAKAGVTMKY